MTRICMTALIGVFLSLLIKDKNRPIALLLSLICGAVILFSIVGDISEILSFTEDLYSVGGFEDEVFSLLIKAVGIAYLVDFSSDICRDSGEEGIAKKLELAGKITITAMALPVISSLFEKIKDVFM